MPRNATARIAADDEAGSCRRAAKVVFCVTTYPAIRTMAVTAINTLIVLFSMILAPPV
jgi:hypothetical protein